MTDSTAREALAGAMNGGEVWTEYRSAVLYRYEDGSCEVRETYATRRTRAEAQHDADADRPELDRMDEEPEVFRAIVSRQRMNPTDWQINPEKSPDA